MKRRILLSAGMLRLAAACLAAACLAALCLLAGCARSPVVGEEETRPEKTLRVALAAYQYDQGYMLAEGWMYDMLITSPSQIREAEDLLAGVSFSMTDELFEIKTAYRMTLRDAADQVTRDVLICTDGTASMEGSVFRMEGAQALVAWLEALKLEEQTLE